MKLDLGTKSQFRLQPGFTTVDVWDSDIVHDLRKFPWPFKDNSAEEIIASHIIEHLPLKEGWLFLKECYRILQPGGSIYIAVPDLEWFIEKKMKGQDPTLFDSYLTDFHFDLNTCISGQVLGTTNHEGHLCMYFFETLAYMMEKTGFTCITRIPLDDPMPYMCNVHYRRFSVSLKAAKPT
jgi:predicted SAM-dependent methyltransferase